MKKIIIYLSIILISNIYAQCYDYSLNQCNNDNSCEWVEDIELENCNFAWSESNCQAHDGCEWECELVWVAHLWEDVLICDCYGQYQVDAGYCQEIEMPECNEENEFQCNDGLCIPIHRVCNNINDCEDGADEINCEDCSELLEFNCSNDDSCEWVENLEIENCYDILDCSSGCTWQDCEAIEGCNWHFGTAYYDPSYCYGEHEVDNSYCEDILMPECSEMNETECSSDNVCEWVEDIEIGQCSQFDNSENSCIGYPGECYWDEDITYGSCNGYDNSQWACNNAQGCYWDCYYGYCGCNGQEITGVDTECIGQYEINNSYCEDAEYQLGDLNLDSAINIQDVIIIINLILNGEFDLVADINLDSTVNVLDVIQLVNIILNN